MAEIILAKGKPTSLKKAVLFRLIIALAIFAFVSLYYTLDINGCQRHSVYVGEIHLAQYDTTLPGHTEINKSTLSGFSYRPWYSRWKSPSPFLSPCWFMKALLTSTR